MKTNLLTLALLFYSGIGMAQTTTNLPLLSINALDYEGGFIIPGNVFGESNANYSNGIIEYNATNNSIFLAGHKAKGGLAEFSIPTIVNSTTLSDLNTSTNLQEFRDVFNDVPNPQSINTITGIKHYNGKLIVNGLMYYNAGTSNTHTSLVVENAADLENSTLTGYFEMEGACHSAGWISDVPTNLQTALGTDYLAGASSKNPINGRLAQGITAFSVDPDDFSGSVDSLIPTFPFMDYSLTQPLHGDYSAYSNPNYNISTADAWHFSGHTKADIGAVSGTNDLWTEASSAEYGFIVPGTRTYLTIGASGGHNSGIGYKAKQNNGNICGGPCAYDADDYYNYYWLWDVEDMIAVKNGSLLAKDVRPYDYGVFEVPFQHDVYNDTAEFHPIVGATFDKASNTLYLSVYDGGATGKYARNPVILAYNIDNSQTMSDIDFNLGNDTTICIGKSINIDASEAIDSIASVKWYKNGVQIYTNYPSDNRDLSSPGLYTVKVTTENGEEFEDDIQISRVNCNCNLTPEINVENDDCVYSFNPTNANWLGVGYYTMGFRWDFGDGTTSTLENPSHTYTENGLKQVTLKHYIIDADGNCCNRETTIEISVNSECAAECGIIPQFVSTIDNTVENGPIIYTSTSVISNDIYGFRWTLNNVFVSSEQSVTLENSDITEGDYLCLTVYNVDINGDCCEEEVCETVSLTQNSSSNKMNTPGLDIDVFPNPNSGNATLRVHDFDKSHTYNAIINDLSGKTLKQLNLNSSATVLDLSHYTSGLYFVYISDGNQSKVLKIIKE